MNPTLDNDLQKAIDDITKNTNSDPVFGDAVAAPAPEPAKPVAPVSRPMPAMPKVARPLPPRPAMNRPVPVMPAAPAPMPEPAMASPIPPAPAMPEPPVASVEEKFSAKVSEFSETPEVSAKPATNMQEVKEAALRDLAPILDKVDMDSTKKFNLYKDIREELGDNSVIAPAYETAKNIEDDKTRADALLYLIDSIDNM